MQGPSRSQRLARLRAEFLSAWMAQSFNIERVAQVTKAIREELKAMGVKEGLRRGGRVKREEKRDNDSA